MTAFLILVIILVIASIATPIGVKIKTTEERKRNSTNAILELKIRSHFTEQVLNKLDELNPPVYKLYDTVLELYDYYGLPIYNEASFGFGSIATQKKEIPIRILNARKHAWGLLSKQRTGKYHDTKYDTPFDYFAKFPFKEYPPLNTPDGKSLTPQRIAWIIYNYYIIKEDETQRNEIGYPCKSEYLLFLDKRSFERDLGVSYDFVNEHIKEYIALYDSCPIELVDDFIPSKIYNMAKNQYGERRPEDMFFDNLYLRINNIIEIFVLRELKKHNLRRSPDGKHDSGWQEKVKEENTLAALKKKYPEDF